MNKIISRFISMWASPMRTLEELKTEPQDTSIKFSMLFFVVMLVIAGAIAGIIGMIMPPPEVQSGLYPRWFPLLQIIFIPLFFILSFANAFFFWILTGGFLRGGVGEYKTIYRLLAALAAFTPANAIIVSIPKIGPYLSGLLAIWILFIFIRGLQIVLGASKVRSWILGGFILVLVGLGMLLGPTLMGPQQAPPFGADDQFSDLEGLDDLDTTPTPVPGAASTPQR